MFLPIKPSGISDNILCLLREAVLTDIPASIITKAFNNITRGVYESISVKRVASESLTIYNTFTSRNLCSLHRGNVDKKLVFFSNSVSTSGSDRSVETLFDVLLCLTNKKAFGNIIQGYRELDKTVLVNHPVTGMVQVMNIDQFFVEFIGEINLSDHTQAWRNLRTATQEEKWGGLLFRKAGMGRGE